MGETTSISWTDATWNVTRGCRRVSAGCQNCYAERQANRFSGPGGAYEGLVKLRPKRQFKIVNGEPTGDFRTVHEPRWSGETKFVTEHLADPLRWKRPRRIFVDSMSDLFYEGFSDEQIAAVYGVMLVAAQHTYQVLTKRPERMASFFGRWSADDCIGAMARTQLPNGQSLPGPKQWNRPARRDWYSVETWPAPWIWHGVSVEDQDAADKRIPHLLATPSVVRFLSCEPLLGPVDLRHVQHERMFELDALTGDHGVTRPLAGRGPKINQVIAGCESGPGARECDVEWLRSLRDQCRSAGTAYFLKQAIPAIHSMSAGAARPIPINIGTGATWKHGIVIELPYLDGIQHAEFPRVD
ncbi:MAG TPA: DUF5131 family protein [Galbitalea sp.]